MKKISVLLILVLFIATLLPANINNVKQNTVTSLTKYEQNITSASETKAFIEVDDFLAAQTNPTSTAEANTSLYPIFFNDNANYKNKNILELDLHISKVTSLTTDQTITMYVADKTVLSSTDVSTFLTSNKVKKYTITIPKSTFSSYAITTIKDVISVDLSSYNITVGENEVIGLGATTDTVSWTIRNAAQTSTTKYPELYLSYTLSNKITNGNGSYSLLANFTISDVIVAPAEPEKYQELDATYGLLKGKNISILGDSISTYKGYSNDATNTNNTIGSNNVYYNGNNGLTGVKDTWWMQTVTTTGMNLLVNNSWSGSSTIGELDSNNASVGIRAENLHDNTGSNAGTNPDIIVLYMGTNDLSKTVGDYTASDFYNTIYVDSNSDGKNDAPTSFAQAYAITLDKITKKYPKAKVYTFTILANNWVDPSIYNTRINNAIKSVSEHYGAKVVDIYTETGITPSNAADYMLSNESTHIHPNEAGHDKITEAFLKTLLADAEKEAQTQKNENNPNTASGTIILISVIAFGIILIVIRKTKVKRYI